MVIKKKKKADQTCDFVCNICLKITKCASKVTKTIMVCTIYLTARVWPYITESKLILLILPYARC